MEQEKVKRSTMKSGEVTAENMKLAFRLCQSWIGGVWDDISEDDFTMRPFIGGLNNFLFTCSLSTNVSIPENQSRTVLLRFYSDLETSFEFVLRHSVIFALLSEKMLVPRLYGMDTQARLEEFLPVHENFRKPVSFKPEVSETDSIFSVQKHVLLVHQTFNETEQKAHITWCLIYARQQGPVFRYFVRQVLSYLFKKGIIRRALLFSDSSCLSRGCLAKRLTFSQPWNPTISRMIARKLAQFHKLDMPISKAPLLITDTMDKWVREAKDRLGKTPSPEEEQLVNKLRSYNIEHEFELMKSIMPHVGSDVVFCHNELHKANILYDENYADEDDAITLIDIEYAAYNYRSYDIGRHFSEWTTDTHLSEAPYFSFNAENYPTRQQQRVFLRAYLSELGREITGEVLEKMCLEADTFSLTSHLFVALWGILPKENCNAKIGGLELADCRLGAYFDMKKKLGL